VRLFLCGVRGSSPTPGDAFRSVGGHTSCVAIAPDDGPPTLALDAGTGLRNLTRVLEGQPFRGAIVLTHLHWDHVMGLPFFPAGDHPDATTRLLAPDQGAPLETVLERLMSPPMFPITPLQLRGAWTFESYGEGTFEAGGFRVTTREIPHGGGRTMGVRVEDDDHAVAYLPDHAPHLLGPGHNEVGELHEAARALGDGVDVLLHDAQYTRAELPGRFTWGHAAADYALELAEACGAARLLLVHHDPNRTDEQVAAIAADLRARARVDVDVAHEGDVILL
jgi:phosphoribosyl 1,2-cyclic phosphodiesterase